MSNTIVKRVRRSHSLKKLLVMVPIIMLVGVTVSLMFPVHAYAETPDIDIFHLGTSLKNWVCYVLLDWSCKLLNGYNDVMGSITGDGILTEPFGSMLGSDMYNLTKSVYDSAIVPVAESILALFMLVQLVKISQRIDATSTLPAVKDIVFLAVTYVLLHWFILNALDVLQAIYQIIVDQIIPAIGTASESTKPFKDALSTDPIAGSAWDDVSIGGAGLVLIASLFSYIIGMAAYIVALVVAYARAWQIYVYAAFSAIPAALLGFEETRQMGINFLKNFVGACLAGAILMFLLVAYPFILSGSMSFDGSFTILGLLGDDMILHLLKFIAISVLLIFGIIKTGSWARDILGG